MICIDGCQCDNRNHPVSLTIVLGYTFSPHSEARTQKKNSSLKLISARKEGRKVTCKQETRTWLFSHACMHDVCSYQKSKRGNENKNMTCFWNRSMKKRWYVGSPRLYGHSVKCFKIIIVTCVRWSPYGYRILLLLSCGYLNLDSPPCTGRISVEINLSNACTWEQKDIIPGPFT